MQIPRLRCAPLGMTSRTAVAFSMTGTGRSRRCSRAMPLVTHRSLLALALCISGAAALGAQGGSKPDDQCFGFAFGAWTPALNWQQAGHGASITLQSFRMRPADA